MSGQTYYIDPAVGDDTWDGLAPDHPFKTDTARPFAGGDRVLFKRGSIIRDVLHTCNGAEGAPVTYGAYGEGEQPAFLGSVPVGNPNLWIEEQPYIWRFSGTLTSEVCNLIFNAGEACGILRWQLEDLQQPGDWHYTTMGMSSMGESWDGKSAREGVLYLCAPVNPGHAWRDIECVLWGQRRLVGGQRHIIMENLSFRNAGVHGYQQGDAHDILIRNCEFRFIGGAVWHRQHRIRFGNGIEFWDGASDIIVEGCLFDNIYDAAVTHQGGETRNIPERIYFRDNLFIDCGLAAYECREPALNIYFEHNTCINSGGGFSMQGEVPPRRTNPYPQPVGYHVFIWFIDANTQPGPVTIRHNLFCGGYGAAISAILEPADEARFVFDHNRYWPTAGAQLFQFSRLMPGISCREAVGTMVAAGTYPLRPESRVYAPVEFSRYQFETGKDTHSQLAQPLFVDPKGGDYRQRADSPCLEAGMRRDVRRNLR
jgi:predicted outer membrane repeat protein